LLDAFGEGGGSGALKSTPYIACGTVMPSAAAKCQRRGQAPLVVANKKSRFSVLTIVCHPFFAEKTHQLIQRSRTLWSSVSSYHINIGDGEDKKPLGRCSQDSPEASKRGSFPDANGDLDLIG